MVRALSSVRRAVIGPPGWRFFSFWLALAVTNLGTWAGVVALQLRILDLTGDQAYVSAIVVAEYLPAIVLGTILGHLLDRVPPRSGLAACELLAAAAWALMTTTGRAGTIVALALICGVTTGIFKIVSTAVVPMLVDDHELDAANGSILKVQTLTNIAGVAVGGALVGLTSANVVLGLNAITFVISGALLLAFSRVPRQAPSPPGAKPAGSRAWLARSLVGARRCLQTPALRMIIFSLPVASVALGISIAAAVPTLRDTYGASNLQTGGIMALDALGIVIGTSLPARYAGYLSGMALLAIGWGGFGIAPDLWIAGPLSVVGGMGNGVVIVRFRTMMQRETPPHERASTIGFAYAVTFGMIVAGQIAVVPLSNVLGQRATFTTAGTIFALGGVVAALCWPSRVLEPARIEAVTEASPVAAR
ncbi:MAG: MFS transporter [Actinomycetota bacterium]|nr:MFS transporter [Actinomycetota bacterium]